MFSRKQPLSSSIVVVVVMAKTHNVTFPAAHLWLLDLSVLFWAFFLTGLSSSSSIAPPPSSTSTSTSSGLSTDFYGISCPAAEIMVKNTVRSASAQDPTVPGKLLRLLFHDCFVEGCDGSILLEGEGTERSDPGNNSVGGFSVIDSAKRVLEIFCPGIVSCADIVALAARDAVEFTGGPSVVIPTGRRDGRNSSASNVRPNIVDTSFTLDDMLRVFSANGLSLDDLVTLSGAHTIGSAHCSAFSERFKIDSDGNMTVVDASLDRNYAAELVRQCRSRPADSTTVNNDPSTPQIFDNQYYKELLNHKGLFQSDSLLSSEDRTVGRVRSFADNQDSFFNSWVQSFQRLTSVGVKTGDEGEIRVSCGAVNA